MSGHGREELERTATKGEEVGRLLACDAVREVIGERLASGREAILALPSRDAGRFARLKAGLEALEELVSALESVVRAGEEARASLFPDGGKEAGSRVL